MNRGASPGTRFLREVQYSSKTAGRQSTSTEADVGRSLLRSWEAISNLKAP